MTTLRRQTETHRCADCMKQGRTGRLVTKYLCSTDFAKPRKIDCVEVLCCPGHPSHKDFIKVDDVAERLKGMQEPTEDNVKAKYPELWK